MKVYMSKDEWYPIYDIQKERSGGLVKEIEITDEEWLDYRALMEKFESWQSKLEKKERIV